MNGMFLFEGDCVAKCPPGYNALGIGTQGRFCSSSWVPFAVTTDKKCAESLPFGLRPIVRSDEIIEKGYLSFENSPVEHFYFLQRFFVDNQLLFESKWKFNTKKTLKERLITASKSGEQIQWRVTDDYGIQHTGSSTWYFSSTAKIGDKSEKWTTSGSSFSNNDGSWGVNKGIVDGSNICGKDEHGWWGHENCGGSQDYLFVIVSERAGKFQILS